MSIAKVCEQCVHVDHDDFGHVCNRPIFYSGYQDSVTGKVHQAYELPHGERCFTERFVDLDHVCGRQAKFFKLQHHRIPKEEHAKLGWWKKRKFAPIIDEEEPFE